MNPSRLVFTNSELEFISTCVTPSFDDKPVDFLPDSQEGKILAKIKGILSHRARISKKMIERKKRQLRERATLTVDQENQILYLRQQEESIRAIATKTGLKFWQIRESKPLQAERQAQRDRKLRLAVVKPLVASGTLKPNVKLTIDNWKPLDVD